MRDNDLFQLALGITSPWFVASSNFDSSKKRLDIRIDFKAGHRFTCPECKGETCPVHDTAEKTWRHLDFFQLRHSSPRAYRASRAPSAASAKSTCRGRAKARASHCCSRRSP